MAYLLVALTIVFTVLGQYYQKLAADQWLSLGAPQRLSRYVAFLLQRYVISAVLCLGLAMAVWLLALQRLEVSVAYPLLAVNYVAMMLLARLRFGEVISGVRWLGVLSILVGIALITGGAI